MREERIGQQNGGRLRIRIYLREVAPKRSYLIGVRSKPESEGRRTEGKSESG